MRGKGVSSLSMEQIGELDTKLVEAAKKIKVLKSLSWPVHVATTFLENWNKGQPSLPQVVYPIINLDKEVQMLHEIMASSDPGHPLGHYLLKTARSYLLAARMLQCVGKPDFARCSAEIYGLPTDRIGNTDLTNLQAADHFIKTTDDFMRSCPISKDTLCIMPAHVAEEMRKQTEAMFKQHQVEIVVDPELTSKAAAGAARIRIRGFTCFAPMDIAQLIQHEAFVHTLTMLNGREQPHLKSLGLGAPRTTLTQEGLALFAELITSTIDVNRLRRIALRVKAIDMALNGADFIDLFNFFLASNQDEIESYQSAARIFRGGDPQGKIVFTKDTVYLEGLIYIHTFLHKAIQHGKLNYPHYLFSGRLTFGDVIELEEFFEKGFIAPPIYLPGWIINRECLTAFLSYSVFSHRIDLNAFELKDLLVNRKLME